MSSTPEERLVRVETNFENTRAAVSTLTSDMKNLSETITDLKERAAKKEDLNQTKNEILTAINEIKSSLTEHIGECKKTDEKFEQRIATLEKESEKNKGAIGTISWMAKTAFGAAIVGVVSFIWKAITGSH